MGKGEVVMWEECDVIVEKREQDERKKKPESGEQLGFGTRFTDHMFTMIWDREHGWHEAKICPYQNFSMDPAALVFHYGQAIFEGMKAFRGDNDQVYMFRPEKNLERLNNSAVRLCMPRIPVDKVLKALKALLYLEKDWIPAAEGASLYIRPTMIAVEPRLDVKAAEQYLFYIILSPVSAYYAEGFNPTRIYVSEQHSRAARGGVGMAKAAGNYAAALATARQAKNNGYTEVLWLDACEKRYVEEVGTSNIFFVLDEELVTPAAEGTILEGVTRDSVLQLAESWGLKTVQRKIAIDEVIAAIEQGRLTEAFGTGTAAVISPVGELGFKEKNYSIADGTPGLLSQRLYEELRGIQTGRKDDPFGWTVRVG